MSTLSQLVSSVGSSAVVGAIVYFQLSPKIDDLKERIKKLEDRASQNNFSQPPGGGNLQDENMLKAIFKKMNELGRENIELKKELAQIQNYLSTDHGDEKEHVSVSTIASDTQQKQKTNTENNSNAKISSGISETPLSNISAT